MKKLISLTVGAYTDGLTADSDMQVSGVGNLSLLFGKIL
jgi:hypothetical protein